MSSNKAVFNVTVYNAILASPSVLEDFCELEVVKITGFTSTTIPGYKSFLRAVGECLVDDFSLTSISDVQAVNLAVVESKHYAGFYFHVFGESKPSPKTKGAAPRVKEMTQDMSFEEAEQASSDDEEEEDSSSEEEADQAPPVRGREPPVADEAIELVDDLEDFDEAITINLDEFLKSLGKKFSCYSVDEIARTIIKICKENKVEIVSRFKVSGSTINDYQLLGILAKKMVDKEAFARAAMSHLSVSVNVIRSDISPDTFFSKRCTVVSDKDGEFVVHNGDYYGYFGSGAYIEFSRKEIRGHKPNPEYGDIWASCALLYTATEFRSSISLPYWSEKTNKIGTRIWTLSEKLVACMPAHNKNLWSVIKRAADRVVDNGGEVIGWIELRDPNTKKNVKKHMTILNFVRTCMKTMAHTSVDFSLDREAWQTLRDKTVFNLPFLKHERKTLTLGDCVVPYNNTVIKFVDAFLNLVKTSSSILNRAPFVGDTKIGVLYGGVTLNGRNTQLGAVKHFFRELWGKSVSEEIPDRRKTSRWDIIPFDLNGNSFSDTLQIDASKRESVLTLNQYTTEFDVVICILDIAEGSVTSHLNNRIQDWLTNFLLLDKLNFVTTKYCCTSKLSVRGAARIIPMNSVLFSTNGPVNVGRSHGAEGVCFLSPSKKPDSPPVCLLPAGFDKDENFRTKCFEGSFMQFHPDATFVVPSDYEKWFPRSISNIGGLRGESGVAQEIIMEWKDSFAEFETLEDTSDGDSSAPAESAPKTTGRKSKPKNN